MCGVFGFFSKNRKITATDIKQALHTLRHRGPDHAGVAVFEPVSRSGIQNSPVVQSEYVPASRLPEGEWFSVMAHTRLSIIDLSDAAHQPMCNEACPVSTQGNRSVWIVYNGEIYNFEEIRDDLISRGHAFKSRTDSEVIIHGYEEWGIDVVQRFRGMFAFALFDKRKNKLVLVRDRLGVKPLKYFFDGETFMFASELKGLMHLMRPTISAEALNMFLTLKYIPSPYTIIEEARKLSPGEMLELDMNQWKVTAKRYWAPQFYPKTDLSFEDAKERFTDLLMDSVRMRTISDVPVGVYLSGGMDSGAIVAFLKKSGIEGVSSFTIKFDRPGYDESEYAQTFSQRFGTKHHEFQIPDLSFQYIQDIVDSLDEPFGDPSYIPTWFLSKFTSGYVKVILSGDGGDEILGGYKRYFIYSRWKILDLLPRISLGIIKKFPPDINKKSFLGKLQRIGEELSLGYWDAYLLRFSGFSDSFKRYVMKPEFYGRLGSLTLKDLISPPVSPSAQGGGGDFQMNQMDDFGHISHTIEKLMWIDMYTYLPDYILTKTDLALMAHSVEGRNPFVDYRLVEFANSLPPEYKFREGGKYILKSLLKEIFPPDAIQRKKMGFNPPIKYWFRANTALLQEIFSGRDFVSGDMFDLKRIHQLIEKSQIPEINISQQLWLIMTLELWRRKHRL